ncbi:MAG TPA: acyltransferase [Bradyrhizobium sp.]|nr:acyltransferase [Bradyrhizobium sp.]
MEYKQRAAGLDGLRGMAAIAVVVYQAINLCDLTIPTRIIVPKLADVPLADWPGRFALSVFNAEAAVNIFFIMSGLVLSASLQREREFDAQTAGRFIFRRILRIYPALIVTILAFGAVSYISLPALFGLPFAPRQMLLNSLLLETGVNGETWTLQAEMLMVPVVLLVVWLQRPFGPAVPFAFVLFALFYLFNGPLFGMLILRASLLAFALGMLIATDAARQVAAKLPAWLWGLCLVAVALERFFAFGNETNALLGSLVLSAIAVTLIFYKARDGGVLRSAPLQFLGRISYSVYLWHAVAMYELFPFFQATVGADRITPHYLWFGLAYAAVVLSVAVPLAWLTERSVERPFIAWSRQILSPKDFYRAMTDPRRFRFLRYLCVEQRAGGLALLLAIFLAVNCISIATVEHSVGIGHRNALNALAGIGLAAGLIPLFLLARFSFGYLVGISFYGVVAGFVWITYFSDLNYDRDLARLSAIASLLMFLLPLLFQTAPLRRTIVLSPRAMHRFLMLALGLAVAVLVWNGYYGRAFVGIREGEELRSTFVRPAILNYITGSLIGAVLPFAFAYFSLQRRYYAAAAALVLIVLFYPVLLNKTVLFAAVWLPFVFLMFRTFEPKRATVLALLIPMTFCLLFFAVAPAEGPIAVLAAYMFGYANIRMFAVPSIAMNYYSEFFASNELTNFCQIKVVGAVIGCPYTRQLSVILADRYGLGNLNASLFSTEGIASVGPVWAPISALVCGIIISVGNSVSARLPPPLIAASAALVVQALLNVALSTSLLSNGLLVLLLLWYITPDPSPKRA